MSRSVVTSAVRWLSITHASRCLHGLYISHGLYGYSLRLPYSCQSIIHAGLQTDVPVTLYDHWASIHCQASPLPVQATGGVDCSNITLPHQLGCGGWERTGVVPGQHCPSWYA